MTFSEIPEEKRHLVKEKEKLTKWKEHFDSPLNRCEPLEIDEIPMADEYLDILAKTLTLVETHRGTKRRDLN